MRLSALFAFGFGNLAMLGWLAAAAAPLLIHLWSRRRYREVPWAAVAFLLAAVRKNSRRIQLQQWLLLAVRTLIILLVVLAVAEPYGRDLAGGGSGPTHKVLVIDTSLSMAARDDEVGRLERAMQLAAELVAASGPGDAFSLLTLADPPRQSAFHDAADAAEITTAINAISQTHGRANLADTLDTIAVTLQLTPELRRRLERQAVYFFTDLQRVTWRLVQADGDETGEPGRPRPQPVRGTARLATLAEQAALVVVDVGSPRIANLAVTDLRVSEPLVTVGRDIAFEATLHEFSDQPRDKLVVELVVDDAPVGQQTVDVPAGSDATVRFTHRFRHAGSHTVAVRAAAGDRLEIDNTRFLVVNVEVRVEVLIVAGRRADGRFLADALDPDPADRSALHPRIITEGELADTDLAPFACVFLSNVAQLTAGEAQRLSEYVRQGRGLAVFLGDRAVADSYNAAAAGEGQPLLPARLGDVVRETRFGLDPLEYRHPIVAPFRGRERAGLLGTPVARYFQLEVPNDEPTTEIALATPGGDALIVTASLGRGRVVLVATAGSLASVDAATGEPWTAWPAWPSFLPVVREILAYAVGGDQVDAPVIVGTPIGGPLPSGTATESPELTRPDGRTATATTTPSTNGRRWSYADTDVSGIYTLRDPSSSATTQFAVNADTRESDLVQLAGDKLPPELTVLKKGVRTIFPDDAPDLPDDPQRQIVLTPFSAWHRPLLWMALALVFVELCLAWLFGRGGR